MRTIKGENLMIFIKEDDLLGNGSTALIPFAMANTCSLNFSVDAFDITSKDSGSWKASLPGMKGWDLSTDNLYTPHYDKLLALAINRTIVKLYWIPAKNTESGNVVTHEPELTVDGETYMYYVGDAWINSISATANNNEASNYNVNFTGTGPLTPSDTLPSVGIGVDRPNLSITAGESAQVVVSNFTGTLTATCSYTGVTTSIANGVVTVNVAGTASAGATHVTISDSGTSTSCYVSLIVKAAS